MRPQDLGIGRLFGNVRDAVIVAEAGNGRIVLWNAAAATIFGYSRYEALGLRVEALVPERLRARHRAGMSRYRDIGHGPYIDSGEVLNLPAMRKTGEEIQIELTLSPIEPVHDDPGTEERLVLAIVRDVTERKRAEQEITRLNEELEERVAERTARLEAALAELRDSEERYRLLVEGAKDYAIFMLDPEGRVADWNEGAERLFGYEEGEIVGEHGSLLFTPEDCRREAPAEELRKARTEGRAQDERWHVRKDGTRFWASGFVRPVKDGEGNLRGFVKVARDITGRKRTEDALRFLAEASTVLASSLDYRETLASVARLAVPRLADWCAVDVLEEDGSLERLAVAHPDPEKVALAYELQERYPPDADAPRGVHQVLRTGEPEMMSEIPAELVEEAARDERHREILRELGLRSYMGVPLVARGRTLGTITFATAESGRRYEQADL